VEDHDGRILLTDEQKSHQTRVRAEMMQENAIMHTIHSSEDERDDQIYTEDISPYLETNLYRPRVVAVKKTIERPFREKVLGRALGCVKSNPNLVWMFLPRNMDAFVRSEEREEEASDSDMPAAV
jgi:ABC-type oligopeptide transport system ATPase subunit